MASGRPIVATVNPDTEVGQLIDQVGFGLCIEPENGKALAQAILELYKNEAQRKEMGKRGRDYVTEHYSRQVAVRLYDELIHDCVEQH
jgi:colanic acid biosynthesis glycosyl transferase WcaI